MVFQFRYLTIGILLICLVVTPARAQSLVRTANTSLHMPERPPVFGYTTADAFPGLSFAHPVALASPPGETNRLFVAELAGVIYAITNLASPTKSVFLDLSGVVFGGTPQRQQGFSSIVFHPGFATNRYFYVVYVRLQDTPSGTVYYDRVSRFQVSPTNPNQALPGSELVLIDQLDEGEAHNINDLKFGPDGYLYISVGDEGDPADYLNNAQRIDKDFFSGILRIDVNQSPGNLLPNPLPASTTNYRVPVDNPFVGVSSFNGQPVNPSQVRTEFYAVGLRNPWRMAFDPVSGFLYCGDVGESAHEEVNVIAKGGNYGWAYLEATQPGPKAVNEPDGFTSVLPIVEYPHGTGFYEGHSVIGGFVYRGSRLAQLQGAYVFADYVSGNIWQLRYDGVAATAFQRLTFDKDICSFGVDPRNGDVLMADLSEGKIKRLDYTDTPIGPPIPGTLVEAGVFSNPQTLTPHPGIVPYDLNVAFWSDGAIKSRWFSVPNPNLRMGFNAQGNWSFPTGTVWIKHFELELTNGVPSSARRLETRLLVKNSDGVYGVTYRWGDSVNNATLVSEQGMDESFLIHDGGTVRTQVWHYPSRSECLACHTPVAGYALGFSTPQLNRNFHYGGPATNQIQALNHAGYFLNPVSGVENMPAMAAATNQAASLEHRARSYLSANCSQCHQPGGSGGGYWDARFTTPLAESGIINGLVRDSGADPHLRVIRPGVPSQSMLLTRITSPPPNRMPPLATSVFDAQGIALINDWIQSLLKIMPLGDGITQGDHQRNSYRRPLWHMLTNAGIRADFVGSLTGNFGGAPPNPDFDLNHEGHWDWTADQLLGGLPSWLQGNAPDVCLMHVGSGDAWLNQSLYSSVRELNQIIDALREANPNVAVLLAKLIPGADLAVDKRIRALNAQVDGIAAKKTTPASPVVVVDHYNGFDMESDTYDGRHPNASGELNMAARWFAALQSHLDRPPLPPPPTNLRAFGGNGQVQLTWAGSVEAMTYIVRRSSLSGAGYVNIATNQATSFVDTGVTNDLTYYYVVSAVNPSGTGPYSAEASALPNARPVPVVRVAFDEFVGTTTPNLGSAGGSFTLTEPVPLRSINVPTNVGGIRSIDMYVDPGNYGVDSDTVIPALAGLNSFTITAWVNNRIDDQGSGGNRIVTWIDNEGDGVDLAYKSDGSLVLGVNQRPDGFVRSSSGIISEQLLGDPANWRFLAVTYDAAAARVEFYIGSNASDAVLDVARAYPGRGPVGTNIGRLTLGHLNPTTRPGATDRMFRGLIDDVQIYTNVLSPAQIVAVQRTVQDTQPLLPTVNVTALQAMAAEAGPTPGLFSVSRSGSIASELLVYYSTGGTASSGQDYVPLTNFVTIPPQALSATIPVTPLNDALSEGLETVTVTLVAQPSYTIGLLAEATVSIADDEPPPPVVTISALDANASEPGSDVGLFTVSRATATNSALMVKYTVGGTAAPGADYASLSGSVVLPPGSLSANIVVQPLDDQECDGAKTVTLTLAVDSAYVIGSPDSASVTIADDECLPPLISLFLADGVADEAGLDSGSVKVLRTGATDSSLTLHFTLSGSASNGLDYSLIGGSVTIPPGTNCTNITVFPLDDTLTEGTETVTVMLAPDAEYRIHALNSATVLIGDNDSTHPLVRLTFDDDTPALTTNSGTLGGILTLTDPLPSRSELVPATIGSGHSVDFGVSNGGYGVDSSNPISALGGLSRFTITGWINNRNSVQASGGNRIVHWQSGITGNGVDLAYRGDGSLEIGIDQPTSGNFRSSPGQIATDITASQQNWRFFAVTYDATTEQVAYYFGSSATDAVLDKVEAYPGVGPVGPDIERLTIGNTTPASRTIFGNRQFRGLIDDLRIYGDLLSLPQIVQVQHGSESSNPGEDPTPQITKIELLPDNQVYLRMTGKPGQTYRILAGSTVNAESPASTNVVGSAGVFEFFEPCVSDGPARFYRVVTP